MMINDDFYLGDDLTIGYDEESMHLAIWAGSKEAPYNIVFFDDTRELLLLQYLIKRREAEMHLTIDNPSQQAPGLIENDG